MPRASKKFGTGGAATITRGGQKQINKQATRYGSILGNEKNVPNVNLNKYIGKKEGGIVAKKGMMHDDMAQDKKLIKKAIGMHDKQEHPGKKTDLTKLKKGGAAKSADVKISMMKNKPAQQVVPRVPTPVAGAMPTGMPRPQAMPRPVAPMMKKGGLASGHKSADGVATKGKTKGKEVKMASGGKTKKKYC